MSQVDRAWAVLSAPTGEHLESFPLDLSFQGIACRVAVDGRGFRHLLVPCVDEDPALHVRPTVLSAVVRPLVFGDSVARYLDITCSDNDLHREFDEVIDDVMETVETAQRPATAAAEALARWRRLFRSRLVRGLSMEAKIGVFAELSMLAALVDVDIAFQIDGWRGPLQEPHDFELQSRCIEVKGLVENSDGITVHGWHQLDVHDGRPLDLVLVTVARDPDGMSISEIVDALRVRVASPATLRSRLVATGWDDDLEAEDDRFAIGAVHGIPITANVPRLIPSMLVGGRAPAGVVDLRYRVSLTSLWPLASEASLAAIAMKALT